MLERNGIVNCARARIRVPFAAHGTGSTLLRKQQRHIQALSRHCRTSGISFRNRTPATRQCIGSVVFGRSVGRSVGWFAQRGGDYVPRKYSTNETRPSSFPPLRCAINGFAVIGDTLRHGEHQGKFKKGKRKKRKNDEKFFLPEHSTISPCPNVCIDIHLGDTA